MQLNDIVKITAQSLYDLAKIENEYTIYLHHINTTAPENVTMSNPFYALNSTIQKEKSSVSLTFLQPLSMQTAGWWAKLIADQNILSNSGNDFYVLQPWNVPTIPNDSGEGKITIDTSGFYFMKAQINVRDIKEITQISYLVTSPELIKCTGKIQCDPVCHQIFVISCVANVSSGDNLGLYIKTKGEVTIVRHSTRTVNFLGQSLTGFSMNSIATEDIIFEDEWISLRHWSPESTNHIDGSFSHHVSNYKDDKLFSVAGTYTVSVTLVFRVVSRTAVCVDWYVYIYFNKRVRMILYCNLQKCLTKEHSSK